MFRISSAHYSVNRHPGCSHFLVIVNNALMNTDCCVKSLGGEELEHMDLFLIFLKETSH